jgi:hypothetical protein
MVTWLPEIFCKNYRQFETVHGGVCITYDSRLHARLVQLPTFTTFESVCVLIHCTSFNAVVVFVIYKPGSQPVTNTTFAEFCDLLDRVGTVAEPLLAVGISTSTLMTGTV